MLITLRRLRQIIKEELSSVNEIGPGVGMDPTGATMPSGMKKSEYRQLEDAQMSVQDFLAMVSIADPTLTTDAISSLLYLLQGKKEEAALVLALSAGGLSAGALAAKLVSAVKSATRIDIPPTKVTEFTSKTVKQADNIIDETTAMMGEKNAKEFLEHYKSIRSEYLDSGHTSISYDDFVKQRKAYFEKLGTKGVTQVGTKSARVFSGMNFGDTFTTTEKIYAYVSLPPGLKRGTKLKKSSRGNPSGKEDHGENVFRLEKQVEEWRKTNAPDKASRINAFYASWRPDGGAWMQQHGKRTNVYMIEIQPGTKISMFDGNAFTDAADAISPHISGKKTGKIDDDFADVLDTLSAYFNGDTWTKGNQARGSYGFPSDMHELVMNGPAPIIVKHVD